MHDMHTAEARVSEPARPRRAEPARTEVEAEADHAHAITLTINGELHELVVQPWVTLLDLLREDLDLNGTKKGCDHGQCGACTVLCDGRRINACLALAVMRDGAAITTIEGVARGDQLHPLQQAFIEFDALQCGYCTPGQICSALGLINEGRAATPAEVRELMSGNICRCGAYPQIVEAVCSVALAQGSSPRAATPSALDLPGTAPS